MSLSSIPFQINIFGIICQLIFCEYFVKHLDLGMKGVGISMGLANGISFVCLNVYPLFVEEARAAMRVPGADAVEGIWEYLSKGLPLSLMMFFEWISFEFMIIMSG